MKFKNHEHVVWDVEKWKAPIGKGWVVGYATTEQPVMGALVIVQPAPDRPKDQGLSDTYPYSCFCLPEVALLSVDTPPKYQTNLTHVEFLEVLSQVRKKWSDNYIQVALQNPDHYPMERTFQEWVDIFADALAVRSSIDPAELKKLRDERYR